MRWSALSASLLILFTLITVPGVSGDDYLSTGSDVPVLRTFSFSWNDTLMRMDVHYLPEVKAGSFGFINVTIGVVDFGSSKRLRVNVVQVEVSDTVISSTQFPFKKLYDLGDTYSFSFGLNFSDPGFGDILPGNSLEYTLAIMVQGTLWDAEGDEVKSSYRGECPIYVLSPTVDLFSRLFVEGELAEGKGVNVSVEVMNVGVESAHDFRVSISCEGIDFSSPTISRIPVALNPGESFNVTYSGIFDEMGGWLIKATINYLNSGGYNSTLVVSKLVDVKGVSKVYVYENFSDGRLFLWGWLNPPKFGSSGKLYYSDNGANWTNIAVINFDTSGYFEYSLTLYQHGIYFYKLVWEGDSDYLPASSGILKINVPKDLLALTLVPSSNTFDVHPGDEVKFRLKVTSGNLSGSVLVTVLGRFHEDGSWMVLKDLSLRFNGSAFSVSIPSDASVVHIKCALPETDSYYPAESNLIKLNVVPEVAWYLRPAFLVGYLGIFLLFLILVVLLRGKRKHSEVSP